MLGCGSWRTLEADFAAQLDIFARGEKQFYYRMKSATALKGAPSKGVCVYSNRLAIADRGSPTSVGVPRKANHRSAVLVASTRSPHLNKQMASGPYFWHR